METLCYCETCAKLPQERSFAQIVINHPELSPEQVALFLQQCCKAGILRHIVRVYKYEGSGDYFVQTFTDYNDISEVPDKTELANIQIVYAAVV